MPKYRVHMRMTYHSSKVYTVLAKDEEDAIEQVVAGEARDYEMGDITLCDGCGNDVEDVEEVQDGYV